VIKSHPVVFAILNMSSRAKPAGIGIEGAVCLFAILLAGCAHHKEFSGTEQRTLAMPPGFLTGPMALLLTNANSYNAQIVYESRTAWGSTQAIAGSFVGAGGKLAFQPELPKASRQNTQGTMVFVWDTAQSGGYALNDALQGYAPYSGNVQFTNVVADKQNALTERIAGHECQREMAMALGNDGSTNLLEVWRAIDLHGFPIRVSAGTNANANVLTITKLQFGRPAEFLMSQDGFTKYESPDAMVTELVARQHNFSRKDGATFGYPNTIEQNRLRPPGQGY
jgi:hypothetical protein